MKIDGSTPAVFTISRSDSELDFKQGYVGFSYPGNKFIASDGAKITTADFFRIGHGGNSREHSHIDGEDTSLFQLSRKQQVFESGQIIKSAFQMEPMYHSRRRAAWPGTQMHVPILLILTVQEQYFP